MDRRVFLKASSIASSSLMVPRFIWELNKSKQHSSRSRRVLIVIQLSGGNDGINTFVPFDNDIYFRTRPTLGLSGKEVLKVTDEIAFNASLLPLRGLYDASEMCIINDVGYPNPNRSHFRSMDIWQTASDSGEYLSTGWIGRYLDSDCEGCDLVYRAIEVDESLSIALRGQFQNAFAVRDPNVLIRGINNPYLKKIAASYVESDHDQANYLYKTLINTQSAASYLHAQSKLYSSEIDYPKNEFGRQLKLISELITSDSDTVVYYVSLGGFDTHVNQKNRHNQLLDIYAKGVEALVRDLKRNGLFGDTLIMTFSEFGRRVAQNGSAGTDHGTANNLVLISGSLKAGGFLNSSPDLSNLDNGDLIFRVDFRSIYAEILDKWLSVSSEQILKKKFDHLNLIS